jgi:phosphomethylpyrimidine synthase
MNIHDKRMPASVTTGPIGKSRKVYSSPKAHDDIRVPYREIVLDPSSGEAPLRVYDPSGPYT